MNRSKPMRRTPMPEFAFCERVTATATSKEHIRRVGAEGLKFGGGAPDTTLCGAELQRGWDLRRPVTPDAVRLGSAPIGDYPAFVCAKCAEAYVVAVSV